MLYKITAFYEALVCYYAELFVSVMHFCLYKAFKKAVYDLVAAYKFK